MGWLVRRDTTLGGSYKSYMLLAALTTMSTMSTFLQGPPRLVVSSKLAPVVDRALLNRV